MHTIVRYHMLEVYANLIALFFVERKLMCRMSHTAAVAMNAYEIDSDVENRTKSKKKNTNERHTTNIENGWEQNGLQIELKAREREREKKTSL